MEPVPNLEDDRVVTALQADTLCPFAASAQHLVLPPHDGIDWIAAGQAASERLSLIDVDELKALDGFVVQLADPRAGDSVDRLGQALLGTMLGLSGPDSTAEDLGRVNDENWWFHYRSIRWFIICFARCYPRTSSRALPEGMQVTLLVFQPSDAFDRRSSPPGTTISSATRERIRYSFNSAGRGYDESLMAQDVEALKFVAPLHLGDAPIRWWELE